MLPVVHGLEKEYGDRIAFTQVNILNPKNQPLMDRYGFSTAPELLLIDDKGRTVGSWDDFVTAGELREAFDAALAAK